MFRETSAQDRPVEKDTRALWNRYRRLALGLAIGALLLVWIVPVALRLSGARASVNASRLVIAAVEHGDFVRDIAAEGRIVAAGSATLYAPAAGRLSLLARAGDKVAEGQVLAKLDSPELLARLEQESAALQSAIVDYERARLEANVRLQEARDARERARVDANMARREYERSRKAFDMGAFSELEVMRAEAAFEKAQFALGEAEAALASRPKQNRFDIESRKAVLDRQRSLVADLQRQVDSLSIRSPVDGQVGQVQVADRASVAKDVPLLTVVDLSALEVEIQVPESLARDLSIGMPAVLSGNGGRWQGRLGAVSPEVVNGQVSTRVRFSGKGPEGLRQNQRLSVRIVLDRRDNTLVVDRGSFVERDAGAYAYVVNDGVAERRPIRIGGVSMDKVEILEGLRAGERIVVSGTEAFDRADRVILSGYSD